MSLEIENTQTQDQAFVNKENSRRWCCDTHRVRRDVSCRIVLRRGCSFQDDRIRLLEKKHNILYFIGKFKILMEHKE
jgi:hypothetical protein